jgi:glycerol-3-phosphate dehydrogenase (NAD(P)+)
MSILKHKIGFLGAGTWGYCLASLLAQNGHHVVVWSRNGSLVKRLNETGEHPKLPGSSTKGEISFTEDLQSAVTGKDMLIEAVTSKGIRPVFTEIKKLLIPTCPIVLTSKGIEQKSELLFSDLLLEIFGEEIKDQIGCLMGPSHAEEVVQRLPTAVVASAYLPEVAEQIASVFRTSYFRVYPNSDMQGVQFGAAMKNIIAIACGIADGLGFGDNTKAALMTRGLHEIKKLAVVKGALPKTLDGLAGMGDLCVTCLSTHSRNYRFGHLIAEGLSLEAAQEKIGAAVEGAYTVVSAFQMGGHHRIELPITEAVHQVLYEKVAPMHAVYALMNRTTKEEHL